MTMTRFSLPRLRAVFRSVAPAAAGILLPMLCLHAQVARGAPSGFATIQGVILDSLHSGGLENARVVVLGTDRAGVTNASGIYRIDSVPAGSYAVQVLHPLLDTLGLAQAFRTPPQTFTAGQTRELDLSIPPGELLATLLCNDSPKKVRGPAAMIGFVRDPDTKAPAVGAKVQIVYYNTDVIGRKTLITGEQVVDSLTGNYRLCGLPQGVTGKVQVFRNGVATGEVPVETTGGFLAMRGFTVAATQVVAQVKNDSGTVKRVALGTAVVKGKVVNKKGEPLGGARVTLQGQFRTVVAQPNGTFTLDSLPSGTQSLEVRRLGYTLAEVPVELSANRPTTTTITLTDATPMLAAVQVEAKNDAALTDVGYMNRKRSTPGGYFLDGNDINHSASTFSVVMTRVPGLSISPVGDGRRNVIKDARNGTGGCVNYWVDGTPYPSLSPGDIDDYIQPAQMVAAEVYHAADTPAQYATPGSSSCITIVVWTQAKMDGLNRKRRKP